jgi:hypothetical protein
VWAIGRAGAALPELFLVVVQVEWGRDGFTGLWNAQRVLGVLGLCVSLSHDVERSLSENLGDVEQRRVYSSFCGGIVLDRRRV